MKASSTSHLLGEQIGGRNIYLVGMMGSGKSSTGDPLAKKLNYSFVDIDQLIEQLTNKSIADIFAAEGEKEFRNIENQVLSEVGKHHSLVVATGGGVVTRTDNWGTLHQGIVIWLNTDKNKILERLKNKPGNRPLIKGSNPLNKVEEIFSARNHLYAEADLHISIKEETPEEVAIKIAKAIPKIIND